MSFDEQPDGDPHGECAAEIQRLTGALENCRLYAARYRNEPWASVIRRFCFEGGATGSPLRSSTSEGPVESAQVAPAAAREKFEAYFAASRRNRGRERAKHLLDRLPDGTYALESTQRHWFTWQSALAAETVKQQEPAALPAGFDRASLMDLADWLAQHDKTINPTPPRAGTMTSLAYAEAFIRAALAVKPPAQGGAT